MEHTVGIVLKKRSQTMPTYITAAAISPIIYTFPIGLASLAVDSASNYNIIITMERVHKYQICV